VSNRIIFIGAPEAGAQEFEAKARADFPGVDLLATNDRDAALVQVGDADALIGHQFQFDEHILRTAVRLRWIQSLTAGTELIVKLSTLRPEVILTSTRGMHGPQMSELVFLQMLALARDFPRMQRNQAAGLWDRWPQPLLWGKTVVIVGVGAIAEVMAPRCKAFGMTVIGISESARRPEGFDDIIGRKELKRGAALADFLVLVVPHTPSTENLIDAAVIAAMKPSAYLINVARGGVLDEDALRAALHQRRLAGAALDVFRERPLPPDHPLWHEDRVIITPHIGGMSDIYLEQAYPIVRDNLRLFLAGEAGRMKNIVSH
jgi:phosphoglycerate dehydrogenase-like enzyme